MLKGCRGKKNLLKYLKLLKTKGRTGTDHVEERLAGVLAETIPQPFLIDANAGGDEERRGEVADAHQLPNAFQTERR